MDSKNIPYSESEYYDKESYKKIGNDKTTLNSKRACYISNENFHARRYAEISLNKLKEKQKKQEEKEEKNREMIKKLEENKIQIKKMHKKLASLIK